MGKIDEISNKSDYASLRIRLYKLKKKIKMALLIINRLRWFRRFIWK